MAIPQFSAPWSVSSKFITLLLSLVCLSVPIFIYVLSKNGTPFSPAVELLAVLGPFFVVGSGLFSVLGYSISERKLIIHRPFWKTSFKLDGLEEATLRGEDFRVGVRLFGSGGFWGWTGWFWNREFGRYRFLGTRLEKVVVLRWKERTLVISPEDGAGLIEAVNFNK